MKVKMAVKGMVVSFFFLRTYGFEAQLIKILVQNT